MIIDDLIFDRDESLVMRIKTLMKTAYLDMTQIQKDEYNNQISLLCDSEFDWLIDSADEDLYCIGHGGGCYNEDDMDRVETAVAYIASALVAAPTTLQSYATSKGVAWQSIFNVPYDPSDYSSVTTASWSYTSIPTATDMARYLGNVKLIKDAYGVDVELPDTMDYLTWETANNIERVLFDTYYALQADIELRKRYIDSAAYAWKSGDLYSGEV